MMRLPRGRREEEKETGTLTLYHSITGSGSTPTSSIVTAGAGTFGVSAVLAGVAGLVALLA